MNSMACPLLVSAYSDETRYYARYIARKYRYDGDIRDIEQEALIGLIRGIDKYDANKENPENPDFGFWGWVCYWIRLGVRKFIWRESCGAVSVAVNLQYKVTTRVDPITLDETPEQYHITEAHLYQAGHFHKPEIESFLDNYDVGMILAKAAEILKPRTFAIIEARFLHGSTLDQVGIDFALSRERIRQIEKAALERIRDAICKTPNHRRGKKSI